MYVCVYIYICIYMCVYTHMLSLSLSLYIYIYIYTHTSKYIYIYIYIHTYIYIYIHTHICIYIYIYTHIYTHINTCIIIVCRDILCVQPQKLSLAQRIGHRGVSELYVFHDIYQAVKVVRATPIKQQRLLAPRLLSKQQGSAALLAQRIGHRVVSELTSAPEEDCERTRARGGLRVASCLIAVLTGRHR